MSQHHKCTFDPCFHLVWAQKMCHSNIPNIKLRISIKFMFLKFKKWYNSKSHRNESRYLDFIWFIVNIIILMHYPKVSPLCRISSFIQHIFRNLNGIRFLLSPYHCCYSYNIKEMILGIPYSKFNKNVDIQCVPKAMW